eukprot:1988830-Pyramimonas_sp.AAC.1
MTSVKITPELKSIREAQCVIRAGRLQANVGYIPHRAFRTKRYFFTNKVWPFYLTIRFPSVPPTVLAGCYTSTTSETA